MINDEPVLILTSHIFLSFCFSIKPENILFQDGIPKVADFGLSKALDKPDDTTATVVGTKITMAPELFVGKKYSSKADIYR